MSGKRLKKRNIGLTVLKSFLITIAVIALLLYIGTAIYFAGHFAFNTYVNGSPAFKKTAAMLEDEMLSGIESYQLVINGRDGVVGTIGSVQLGMVPQMGSQYEDILKSQNPLIWPVYLFTETHLTTDTVVDFPEDLLKKAVDALPFFDPKNIVAPEDAHISETSGENGFYVVGQTQGSTPVAGQILDEVRAALDVLEPEIELSDACYTTAKITEDDPTLAALCDSLNTYCKVKLYYEFGDDRIDIDGTRVKQWCDIDGTSVTLNEEKVRNFVNEIAREYDTFGKTRKLKTHDGGTVDVTGGDYGWWMDRATEAKELIEGIKSGESGRRIPVYFGTAAAYGDADWGDSYVEINLDDQHLWVYQNGSVVEESDFVSGCVNKRRTTPVGTYAITYKERDATLTGENYSSAVSYWMPFNGNVGMHDASWRSSFGGEIYVTNGSHGCINLPKNKAEAIYDIVTKGEAVLVYGGKELPEEEEEEEPELDPTKLTPEEIMALPQEQQLKVLTQLGILGGEQSQAEGNE